LANHKSAEKRARQNLRARSRNQIQKTRVKNATKQVLQAVEGGSADAAQEALKKAMRTINQAASSGTYHSKTASRKIARLSRRVARVEQA